MTEKKSYKQMYNDERTGYESMTLEKIMDMHPGCLLTQSHWGSDHYFTPFGRAHVGAREFYGHLSDGTGIGYSGESTGWTPWKPKTTKSKTKIKDVQQGQDSVIRERDFFQA